MRGRGGAAITPGLVISVTFNLIFLLLLTYQWKMTGIDRYWWDMRIIAPTHGSWGCASIVNVMAYPHTCQHTQRDRPGCSIGSTIG